MKFQFYKLNSQIIKIIFKKVLKTALKTKK